MTRQHGIILIVALGLLSALFYWVILNNLSFFEHNDRAATIVDEEIADAAIPITRSEQGHILIPVAINGTPDLLFILDTGAPYTLIFGHEGTEAVPLSLGRDAVVRGNGTGAPAKGKLVDSMNIAVGPVEIDGLKGRWLPRENVPFFPAEGEIHIDGIIGYDLFTRFVVEIDLTRSLIKLHESLPHAPEVSDPPIPLRFKHRKPHGKVEVVVDDGEPMPIARYALIDTGSIDQLELTMPTDPATPFPPLPADLMPSLGFGLQGDVEGQIGRVDHLQLGDYEFANIPIEFVEPHGGAPEGSAQLGMGILSRFDLIFDYRGKQLFMIERADSFAAFEFDMSGLDIVQDGERFVVRDVTPGTSAAETNFRPGDTITKIEGMPVSNLHEARSILSSGDGKKISVCRDTRKGEKCKTLRLKRRI